MSSSVSILNNIHVSHSGSRNKNSLLPIINGGKHMNRRQFIVGVSGVGLVALVPKWILITHD
ncbi:hypothetical protein, partial [Aeromonas caviae]|uniref:hypothetical protein n=1 Tax=Aeromonas caviae TaxID=648 RepID=UPI001F356CB3